MLRAPGAVATSAAVGSCRASDRAACYGEGSCGAWPSHAASRQAASKGVRRRRRNETHHVFEYPVRVCDGGADGCGSPAPASTAGETGHRCIPGRAGILDIWRTSPGWRSTSAYWPTGQRPDMASENGQEHVSYGAMGWPSVFLFWSAWSTRRTFGAFAAGEADLGVGPGKLTRRVRSRKRDRLTTRSPPELRPRTRRPTSRTPRAVSGGGGGRAPETRPR